MKLSCQDAFYILCKSTFNSLVEMFAIQINLTLPIAFNVATCSVNTAVVDFFGRRLKKNINPRDR